MIESLIIVHYLREKNEYYRYLKSKRGVGKSTVAVHLALHLSEKNNKVLFIDLDPQANATKTLKKIATSLNFFASDLFKALDFDIDNNELINVIEADSLMADVERYDSSVL